MRVRERVSERHRPLGLMPGSLEHQCKENACVRMASVGEIGFPAVNAASIVLAEDGGGPGPLQTAQLFPG